MKTKIWKKTIAVMVSLYPFYLSAAAQPHNFQTIDKPAFGGFYVGAGLGGTFSQYKTINTTTLLFPSAAFFANSQNTAYNSGANFLATLNAGYLQQINRFYIGPEVYVNIGQPSFTSSQSANANLPTESLNTTTKGNLNTSEFGIDLRLGASATPTTLLYGLVGAAFNKIWISSVSTIARPVLPLSTTTSNTASSPVVGLRLGAGIEQKISSNINLRVNYVYTSYPSRSNSSTTSPNAASPFFQLGPIANNTSVQIHTHAIFASIIYQFNDNILGKSS